MNRTVATTLLGTLVLGRAKSGAGSVQQLVGDVLNRAVVEVEVVANPPQP